MWWVYSVVHRQLLQQMGAEGERGGGRGQDCGISARVTAYGSLHLVNKGIALLMGEVKEVRVQVYRVSDR